MIRLNLECETVEELHKLLAAVLAGNGVAPAAATPKPAANKKTPPKAEEPKEDAVDPFDDRPRPAEVEEKEPNPAPSNDEKSLRTRATKFAAKNGPTALIALQKDAGAPNGKISEIIGDEGRMAKLGELLAKAEF